MATRTAKKDTGANLGFEATLWQVAHGDTFHNHAYPDLKADYVLANPPFNDSDRRGETLFIDARKMGTLIDRVHRELTEEDVAKIAGAYHAWRGDKGAGKYADVLGFCKAAKLAEIRKHGHVLTPGRYVGAEAAEDDGELFEKKMQQLAAQLRKQQAEGAKLDAAIAASLKALGYGG